ncbi:glycosyltransferase involved in cell wall biosynthesis [Microbacterium trichothecenolyticum]|uniref:glycosyltransferase family 2 protein n=1 Tax=Microbacterium trichothecenolyticum TaxID=69370 RepID=UPI0028620BA9|nr:glycosyltransferase [Microbacterium trichothecenolyticum]MDR7185316.1 glycosyltransferase involved in cell wall biosynthesis [Microbacterium trichothecenolyticum]
MPGDTPRVGIVLRTKNRPWFLRRALRDIAAQTYPEWFVEIVNDGGDAADVDSAIAELAPDLQARIAVAHHGEPQGRSAAANVGMRRLHTEFVVLHDDDDLWHPAFLTRAVDWLDAHADDIGVVARTEIVYEAESAGHPGQFQEVGRAPFWEGLTDISYSDLLQINRFVPIAYVYRRSLHDEVGMYREDVHAAEDWEFNLRAAAKHHIGFLGGEPLAFWMQRVGVEGETGNSMFVLADDHRRYDATVRDEALRRYVAEFGPGLPLFLTRFIEVEVSRIVREQLSAELDRRPSDLDRVRNRLRRVFRRG